jgi:hypothetical protein
MTSMMKNGRARKTLADQLDRLDTILDGLADALNEAVAEAVAVAVKAALAEALAHPELLQRVQEGQTSAAPVQTDKPSALRTLLAKARLLGGRLLRHLSEGGKKAGSAIRSGCSSARDTLAKRFRPAQQWLTFVWHLRGPVLLALGAGSAVGLACYVAGPLVASLVSGLSGTSAALDAQVRRMHRRMQWSGGRE